MCQCRLPTEHGGVVESFQCDVCRFRIGIDIVFGGQVGRIAVRRNGAAHEDKLFDTGGKLRIEADGGGQVGQRTERDQRQLALVFAR